MSGVNVKEEKCLLVCGKGAVSVFSALSAPPTSARGLEVRTQKSTFHASSCFALAACALSLGVHLESCRLCLVALTHGSTIWRSDTNLARHKFELFMTWHMIPHGADLYTQLFPIEMFPLY